MRKDFQFKLYCLLLISFTVISAQSYKISGVITDSQTGEKLFGASVQVVDQNVGSTSDANGLFVIENVRRGVFEIAVTYIGYSRTVKNVRVDKDITVNFSLQQSSVLFEESVVKGSRAVLRETPVAFSEIKGADLEFKLASRDIPQELATTPSVYSSLSGGGAGDATLFVRGFSQRNVAIMINGVPVNDMENKWVYWSNWAGLGDVTDEIQIQRGLGASPYSINAVGGLLNIITEGVGSSEEYLKIKSEYGSNNLVKGSIALHKKLSNKFAVTALLSRKTWDGYAVGTYHKEWTYFIAFGGVFGNHALELRAVGSPQEHGQRPGSYARLTVADWDKYGKDFNYAVGRLNGDWFNEVANYYHKPSINLNWNWQLNKNSTLSTIVYYSLGKGGGSGTLGPFAPAISKQQDSVYQNYRDYDKVWRINSTTIDIKYSSTEKRSTSTILRNAVNNHDWYGLLSTLKTNIGKKFILNVGIDGRYYIGEHYQAVRDLIGGDYYIDFRDVNNLGKMARVGDKVGYHNDFFVRQFGGCGQVEFKDDAFTAFVNISASHQGAKRKDYFLYKSDDPFNTTDWQNFFGYTAKSGLNYNLNVYNRIFFNLGYFSSAPMVNNIFANNTNVVSKESQNEKVLGIEFGYGLSSTIIAVQANAFYTKWRDRAITISYSDRDPFSGELVTQYANISGSDQMHSGAELEMVSKPIRNLELKAALSYVVGKYENDVSAIISPENNPTATKKVDLYVQDLYVSEFPQQQATLQASYRVNLFSGLNMFINPVYKFLGKYYSRFDPDLRTNPNDRTQSWQIPDCNIVDFHLRFSWYITNSFIKRINLNFNVFNLLDNTEYIVEAQDGGTNASNHNLSTARVFFGRGRWANIGIGFNL